MKIYDDSWISDRRRAVVVPQHGCADTIAEGKHLFDIASMMFHTTIGNIPEGLAGENFLFTDSFSNIGMTVKKSGWMLIVVEQEPETPTPNDISFYLNLRIPGTFKKVADFEEGELLPGWQTPLSLLGGFVLEGTDFQSAIIRGGLSVVICDIDPGYVPIKQTEMVEENLRLSMLPCGYLSGEALAADMEYYRPRERGYQAVPTIAHTPNGTFYVAIMADPFGKTFCGGENYYGYIPILRSRDGINWDNPITVFDPDKDGPSRVYDPALFTVGDRLYLIYTQQVGIESNYSGRQGQWITYCDNPESDAPVWSEPKRMFDGFYRDIPLKASDGKWYFAAYFSRHAMPEYYPEECLARGTGPRIYRSEDLENFEYVCTPEGGESDTGEATIAETANGELILIERNDLGSRYTKAKLSAPDKWDSYKLLRYDNNDENSPKMQTVYSLNNIKRLASGNLLLTYHNNNTKVRDNIAVALSKDDGVTWPYKLTLDTRIHSSYAMIDEMENGDIIVVYDQGRGRTVRPGSSEILLSRLREEDIIAGKPVTERAVLKRLVSRYEEAPREDCLTEQLSAAERIMAAHPEAVTAITSAAQKAKENLTLENYITLCETCDSFIN